MMNNPVVSDIVTSSLGIRRRRKKDEEVDAVKLAFSQAFIDEFSKIAFSLSAPMHNYRGVRSMTKTIGPKPGMTPTIKRPSTFNV